MGDIGEEATAGVLGRLQPPGHVVERPPERAHSQRAGRVDAGVVVAAAEPLDPVEQVADRTGEATVGDERCDERGPDDSDDDRRRAGRTVTTTVSTAG
ncbi:hypothetical protein BH18ACT3_BH18ACT3_25790 [soil metagenome]